MPDVKGSTHIPPPVFFQNVTATRWVLSTTGATARASVSAGKAPQGPSVTTACQDTTGSKAVIVSLMMDSCVEIRGPMNRSSLPETIGDAPHHLAAACPHVYLPLWDLIV